MALFKLTTKRRFTAGRNHIDPGMSVEVYLNNHSSSNFPFGSTKTRELVAEQFENKYGVEIGPSHVGSSYFEVECLSKR